MPLQPILIATPHMRILRRVADARGMTVRDVAAEMIRVGCETCDTDLGAAALPSDANPDAGREAQDAGNFHREPAAAIHWEHVPMVEVSLHDDGVF